MINKLILSVKYNLGIYILNYILRNINFYTNVLYLCPIPINNTYLIKCNCNEL